MTWSRRRLITAVASATLGGCARIGRVPVTRSSPRDKLPAAVTDPSDLNALRQGNLISYPVSFRHGDGKYIGATTHIRTLARPADVLETIFDVERLPQWLAFNHETRVVEGRGDDLVVELLQGVDPFLARFSLRVTRRDPVIRWRLDKSRPHDIADLWGFFTARPFGRGRSLMTTGIAVDLGSGVLRMLEKEILRVIPDATMDARFFVEREHRRANADVRH